MALTGEGCAKPLRADARKNRERILQVAEEVFAAQGVGVPIDEIACRAGVGVGTLYRHFPTKEALFVAVVASQLQQLVELSEELLVAPADGEALFTFIQQLGSRVASKRDLAEALAAAGIDIKAQLADTSARLEDNMRQLLQRSQELGTVRPDVSPDDVFGLVVGTCMAAGHNGNDDAKCGRMVAVVCDGLRAVPAGETAPPLAGNQI